MTNQVKPYASFWRRLFARFIDTTVLSVISLIFVLFMLNGKTGRFESEHDLYKGVQSLATFINFILFHFLYYPFFEANGGTIGKRALSIQSVSINDNMPISLGQAYKRSMFLIWPLIALVSLMGISSIFDLRPEKSYLLLINLTFIVQFIAPLAMLWTKKRQGWHDSWANTVVVKTLNVKTQDNSSFLDTADADDEN